MAAEPGFLTQPVPPLSECIPALAGALRAERELRREEARRWRMQLDLPAELQQVALFGAHRSDQLLDEWLNSFVSHSLRKLADSYHEGLDDAYGPVLPLQRRL